MIGIYKITNKINNKIYIGQSNNINRRKNEHRSVKHETNESLKKAYIKYGLENFDFQVLEECKLEELNDREKYWIKLLKPQYNRTSGGNGSPNHKISEETKQLLKQKGKDFWNSLDNETKNKIITNNLKGPKIGHEVSKETRQKLREHNLGKKQSLETINKRKQTMIKKKKNGYIQTNENHNKKVICIEKNKIYKSVKEASEDNNVTASFLSGVIRGKYKTCKGLHFEYYQENSSVTTNPDECKDVG